LKTKCEIVQKKLDILWDGSAPVTPKANPNDKHFSAMQQQDKLNAKARFITNVDM
jgi:hypothetical protein